MKKPIINIPLKFGAIASLILIALFVVLFYAGKHPLNVPITLDIRLILLPLFMFFTTKEFRDNHNGGVLHFWQGLTVGFITFAVIAVFVSSFIIVLSNADASFLAEYITERMTLLETNKEALIEALNEQAVIEQLRTLPLISSFDLALDYFIKTLGIGLFLNIIIAVILRKQPKLN